MLALPKTPRFLTVPRLIHKNCGHPCLGFLLRKRSGLHGVTENALVALHRKLGIVAHVVACDLLPGEAALLRNDLDMMVSLSIASG
jgi:hypothetical protein